MRSGGDCASLVLRRILLDTGETAWVSMGKPLFSKNKRQVFTRKTLSALASGLTPHDSKTFRQLCLLAFRTRKVEVL